MLHRFKITPRSPLATPLMSDTLFGHFCWAILYREGESFLADFLDSYGNGKPAPVLFSSGFISGYLPRPTIPAMSRNHVEKFLSQHFGEGKKDLFNGLSLIKGWEKRRNISVDHWLILKEDYSEERLYGEYIKEDSLLDETFFEFEISTSNMISRVSGAVPQEGGGLFTRERHWYHEGVNFDLYVEVNQQEADAFVKWFLLDYLQKSGFGSDKSIGMGSLQIDPDESFDESMFEVQEPNARLSLSFTSFIGMEQYDAFYRLKTKFGKLGGTFSTFSPTGGNPKPFKKPILMFEPGAVFCCAESLTDKPLLKGVHSDARIRHCGIPITLPFRIRKEV